MKINVKLFFAWAICFILSFIFQSIGVKEMQMVFYTAGMTLLILGIFKIIPEK